MSDLLESHQHLQNDFASVAVILSDLPKLGVRRIHLCATNHGDSLMVEDVIEVRPSFNLEPLTRIERPSEVGIPVRKPLRSNTFDMERKDTQVISARLTRGV
jgi:hypothetical protein